MKIMCDTNVIMDVLLEREPFAEDLYKVLKLCEEHKMDGFISAFNAGRSCCMVSHAAWTVQI